MTIISARTRAARAAIATAAEALSEVFVGEHRASSHLRTKSAPMINSTVVNAYPVFNSADQGGREWQLFGDESNTTASVAVTH